MNEQQSWVKLRDTLARLYTEESDARRVVADAGLDDSNIPFSSQATINWTAILKQAQKENKMFDLMAITVRQYNRNKELLNSWRDYIVSVENNDEVLQGITGRRSTHAILLQTVIGIIIVVLMGTLVAYNISYIGLINNQRKIDATATTIAIAKERSVTSTPGIIFPSQIGTTPYDRPGPELALAFRRHYTGTKVIVDGPFTKSSVDAKRFNDTMKPFQDATGITIDYIGTDQFENTIFERVQAGYGPDLADFAQPGLLASLSKTGKIVDLTQIIKQDWLKQNYEEYWLRTAQMPSPNGKIQAGVWWRASIKSLVWYPKKAFDAYDYKVPQTWDEMQKLMDHIVADGRIPWCIGIESGNATGWPATDWIEDIMLRTTSLDNYDEWTKGQLSFTDPVVKNAVAIMSNIWLNNKYVYGGRRSIVNTNFRDAPKPMFDNPPKCWLHRQSDFIAASFPPDKVFGTDYDVFYLPPIDPRYGKPVLMAGDIVAMFNDSPQVRAVIQYMTLSESLRIWLSEGGTFSVHRDTPGDWYKNPIERKISDDILSKATSFGFDGSDLMAKPVGQGTFWKGMTDYISGTIDLDAAMQEIQNGWSVKQ